MAVETFSMET